MAAASFVFSLYLRLGDRFDESIDLAWQGAAVFAATCAVIFFAFKLHRRVWRYASLHDLVVITKAVTLSILIFFPCMFILTRLEGIPRSLLFINWLVLLALLGGSRFLYRFLKYGFSDTFRTAAFLPALFPEMFFCIFLPLPNTPKDKARRFLSFRSMAR